MYGNNMTMSFQNQFEGVVYTSFRFENKYLKIWWKLQ